MRVVIMIIIACLLMGYAGWMTYSSDENSASISVNKTKIKEDTSSVVEETKRATKEVRDEVEKAAGELQEKTEEAVRDLDEATDDAVESLQN